MPLKSLIEFSLKRRVSFLFIQFSSVLHSNENFIIIAIAVGYGFIKLQFSFCFTNTGLIFYAWMALSIKFDIMSLSAGDFRHICYRSLFERSLPLSLPLSHSLSLSLSLKSLVIAVIIIDCSFIN